ncbi:MAG: starch synthase [Omnitrophica WOR_2 bacterium GWA2_37_7]|nr:MAG: starch synthase [Omnitrophica WOR_2 bacterium GWA2_37_7]OGX57730.1 MAG: starch synthase [Omnitrophica WOR_2 bacterium RIFOXYC2_FULL_38_12]
MKIAMCSSEIVPFAKTGGLGDVCGALPLALERIGVEVVLFLPKYRSIEDKGNAVEKVSSDVSKTTIGKNIDVYFIDNEKYFYRDGLYGDNNGDFHDNLERFSFFCLKILETIKNLNIDIDVIHCHDWQTALIPVYLKERFGQCEIFKDIKTIQTIHNLAFQGIFDRRDFPKLGLRNELFDHGLFEFYGSVNLLKGAIYYADQVTTVSKQYAKEIKTREFGFGLEHLLLSKGEKLIGILNGLDYEIWDPQKDDLINVKYSNENIDSDKIDNKEWLQKEVGFKCSNEVPVFGLVGRLSHQKGIDLLTQALDELMTLDIQVVIQGVGEERYYEKLSRFVERYPQKIAACFEFNEHLAHQIYAGSDMFLMPSIYEPCGLSQLIAFRYATVPIVYKTGGFIDTVIPHDNKEGKGNGFIFDKYDRNSFVEIIKVASEVYKDKQRFHKLVEQAISVCFSWNKSAEEYKTLYESLKVD